MKGPSRSGEGLRQATAILALVTSLLLLPGCQLVYLCRVAAGQLELINGAIPVEDALQSASLSETFKDRLSLAEKVKRFGETNLGLKKTDSYSTVNLDPHSGKAYTVSASYKDRLVPVTWWFPVVGRLPYIGFFDLESARSEQRKLIEMDLDTMIGRVEAYSTLGWFNDPLTLNLIEKSPVDLAETLLHEMTHATLYVKGQGEFNEGLATLVGKRGAYLFMRETFGPSHQLTREARESIEDEGVFSSSFLRPLLAQLNQLYASSLSYQEKLEEREKVFARSLDHFKSLSSRFQTSRFGRFGQGPLNNAILVSLAVYHGHYALFEQALQQSGDSIPALLRKLRAMSEEEGNMVGLLQEWLGKRDTPMTSTLSAPPYQETRMSPKSEYRNPKPYLLFRTGLRLPGVRPEHWRIRVWEEKRSSL